MKHPDFTWRGIVFTHAPGTDAHFRVKDGSVKAYVTLYSDHAHACICGHESIGKDAVSALESARAEVEKLATAIGIMVSVPAPQELGSEGEA